MTNKAKIVLVSGRSGSGKSSALNVLEDLGYYRIDNLPLLLLPSICSKLLQDKVADKLAMGVDVRTPRADLSQFEAVRAALDKIANTKVLYTTARSGVLVARFAGTRRVHPLFHQSKSLKDALDFEKHLLAPIFQQADIKIDTSETNIHELKARILEELGVDETVTVSIMSFGFKYGIPIDADFVFDVRTLPNPHWYENLRDKTGQDSEVKVFFLNHEMVGQMMDDIITYLNKWLPSFIGSNRHNVLIAIGCTGGKHRSVYMANGVAEHLILPNELCVSLKHREQSHW